MAFGLVPSIELPHLTGCRLSYRSELGGWIPERDQYFQTTVERVYVAGDGAGVDEATMINLTARDSARSDRGSCGCRSPRHVADNGWQRREAGPATGFPGVHRDHE
jgi:hypothetical protein